MPTDRWRLFWAPGMIRHWLLAFRPRTLPLSVVPVLVGSAAAWGEGAEIRIWVLLAALLSSLLIQIGTNLHNDAGDFERGADTPDRLGPERATAQGWLTAQAVNRASWISFAMAFLLGIYLVTVGGWPILLLGLASITAGAAYTGGPNPIAYTPFGELFVFLFFGLAAVMGSHYLQAGEPTLLSLRVGSALGLLASAVLLVNNYRDLDTDRTAGKLTLVSHVGRPGARGIYIVLLTIPFLLSPTWATLLAMPEAMRLAWRLWYAPIGQGLNPLLAQTARFQAVFGILMGVGIVLGAT